MTDIFKNLQSSPVGLAGFMVMSGMRMKDALPQAAAISLQNQQAEQMKSETQQQQYLASALPQLLAEVDPNDPQGSLMRMTQKGVPFEIAQKAVKFAVDSQQDKQRSAMMQNLFGGGAQSGTEGGGVDPATIAKAGALTGDPTLLSLATFMQGQGNRNQDMARDSAKTQEGYYADLDKRYSDSIKDLSPVIDDYNIALDLAKEGNAASDYQLIKLGVQAFDKRNSAVTDDEFKNMQQTGNINTRLQQILGKYAQGDTLTSQQRREIISGIQQRAKQNRSKIDKINSAFSKKAGVLGVDFENIRAGYDPGDLRSLDEINAPGDATEVSMEDIRHTAKLHNMTVEEVMKQLGIQQ